MNSEVAREVVEHIGDRAPISAAAGELLDWRAQPHGQALLDVSGIAHLKLGLANCASLDWHKRWTDARDIIRRAGKGFVIVVYADAAHAGSPGFDQVLETATSIGAAWMLWDTFDKSGPPLLRRVNATSLRKQLVAARTAGMRTVMAGGLCQTNIAQLPLQLIDMIGVRGAACHGGRDGVVCAERVASLRHGIARHADCMAATICSLTTK